MAKKLEQGGEKSILHRPKVLIVDDEITLCNLFKKALTEEGYDVLTAENGEKAIDVVRKDAPELVLLDIRMPGIGGMDVLRHLKAIKSNLIVVMLTGYGTIESARLAMMLGAYDYITKPFNISYLKAIVKDALKSTDRLKRFEERHCHSATPCMWEVAVRAFGLGDDEFALEWMEDSKIPTQDKTALMQISNALVSKMKAAYPPPLPGEGQDGDRAER